MISLNKPPTPLTLRRPPDSYSGNRQSPEKTSSYNRPFERSDRSNFNRQSSTETNNSQPSSKLPPRFQRQRESSAALNQPKLTILSQAANYHKDFKDSGKVA